MKKWKFGEQKPGPRDPLSTKIPGSAFINVELILEDGCLTKGSVSQAPLQVWPRDWFLSMEGEKKLHVSVWELRFLRSWCDFSLPPVGSRELCHVRG